MWWLLRLGVCEGGIRRGVSGVLGWGGGREGGRVGGLVGMVELLLECGGVRRKCCLTSVVGLRCGSDWALLFYRLCGVYVFRAGELQKGNFIQCHVHVNLIS